MFEAVLGLFVPAIALVLAVTFALLWRRMPDRTYVASIAAGFAMLASGFVWFHYFVSMNNLASILVMHVLFSATAIFLCWGLVKRANRHFSIPTAIFVEIVAGVMMAAALVSDDLRAWLFTVNLGHGLLFALTTQELSRSKDRGIIDNSLMFLAGLLSAIFFIRPVFTLFVQETLTEQAYRESGLYPLLLITVGVWALAISMTLLIAVLQDQIEDLKKDAEIDPLTGLRMRGAFEADAKDLLIERMDDHRAISMIVADIDHFKQVNDIWGHQTGDVAISNFGRLINDMVRDNDLCGRVGGEEFCILVSDCDGPQATRLAERLRLALATLMHDGMGPDLRLTASFGVSSWRTGEGYGAMFARADAALYAAKQGGRNTVVFEGETRNEHMAVTAEGKSDVERRSAAAG
uniref:GGDEF domain-containing protein n=1 Tax=uncultured Erythrobacter sp. TaxID=263913 RepID=UPI0026245BCD|nr:GGDEF domain-containing protein [uncultured Erythrobacter sp.]